MPFFIIFILIPLLEVSVFIALSDYIGLGTALLLALLTAITGGAIVKHQGIQTFFAAQKSLNQGAIPSKELFDGLCLIAAGAMLITPGFVTDTLGFLLLVPNVRTFLKEKLVNSKKFQSANFQTNFYENETFYAAPKDRNVIEGEYETIKEEDKP